MTTQHSDTIELEQIARAIARGWRALVGVTAFGLLAAAAIVMFAPRKFTGIATVVLKTSGGGGGGSGGGGGLLSQVGGLGDLTAGLLSGKSPMETEVEILQSRAVVEEAIDSLRMQAKVIADVPVAAAPIIARIDAPNPFAPLKLQFTRAAGSSEYTFTGETASGKMTPGVPATLPVGTITFAANAKLPATFQLILRDRTDAVKWVTRHLKVAKDKGEVAKITYKGDDSLTAAAFPNELLDRYFARRKGIDRGINQKRVEFLTAKNDSMERALSETAAALRRAQEKSGVVIPIVSVQADFTMLGALRSRLTDMQVEQGALTQLITQIKSRSASPRDLAAYPRFVNSPAINNIISQITGYESQITQLLARNSTEGSPEIIALRKNIADAEGKLLPYAEQYASSLEQERKDLQQSFDAAQKRVEALPAAAETGGRLERDILDLSKLAALLQAQIVEAKLAAIGEGGDVRPLDLAVVSREPSFPSPLLTFAAGGLGGLFLGTIAALIFGSVGRWVRDPFDIERSTGVPALEFDPAVPLLVSNGASRTIVVAPIGEGVPVTAVVNRLAQTASSQSLTAAILELPAIYKDVNGSIARLEAENDLVIVQLPSLVSDTAAAALQHGRPVLLVAPGRRVARRQLINSVQLLRRLEVPVAGIVMSNGVNGTHRLPR